MRLGTKGRIAVTAMVDIALREASGPVSLMDVATRQHISLSYLEQLFSKLRRSGLVTSVRGPGGGYCVGGGVQGITVKDIICAVEDAAPKAPDSDSGTLHGMTQALWDAMHASGQAFMQTVTLQSLVREQMDKGVPLDTRHTRKQGVFKRPTQPVIQTRASNSVFALGHTLHPAP